MERKAVLAAGGIVVRSNGRVQVAVVQLRKYPHWVLPKGKLKRNETARNAAKREVLEETGYRVKVQEFLGVISYESTGKSKIVQFWRMQALGASRPTTSEIKEVRWLSVRKAVEMLTYAREQLFLRHVMAPSRLRTTQNSQGRRKPRKKSASRSRH